MCEGVHEDNRLHEPDALQDVHEEVLFVVLFLVLHDEVLQIRLLFFLLLFLIEVFGGNRSVRSDLLERVFAERRRVERHLDLLIVLKLGEELLELLFLHHFIGLINDDVLQTIHIYFLL